MICFDNEFNMSKGFTCCSWNSENCYFVQNWVFCITIHQNIFWNTNFKIHKQGILKREAKDYTIMKTTCLKPHYIVALCLISGHTSPKRSPKNMPILAPPKNCNFLSAIPVSAAQDCVQCLTTSCKSHCTALHYRRSRLGRICGEAIATKHNQFTLFVCAWEGEVQFLGW